MTIYTTTSVELNRQARDNRLGTLGDTSGANCAKVEVSWWFDDPGLGYETTVTEHAGHFYVYATGDEPDDHLYATFDRLTTEAMERRRNKQGFTDWQIDDIYAA